MAWIKVNGNKTKWHAQRKGWTYNKQKKLYNSKQWQDTRRAVLFNEPLCRVCIDKGIETWASEVDHINPLSQGGESLSMSNLQPICKECHQKKTGRECMLNRNNGNSQSK